MDKDIIVGLVRPERRNVGILLDEENDIVGSPDGLAVVRVKHDLVHECPTAWLFSVLRSEKVRLQFWTESGGTSYGKLTLEQIESTLIPLPPIEERYRVARIVGDWIDSAKRYSFAWSQIGTNDDRALHP